MKRRDLLKTIASAGGGMILSLPSLQSNAAGQTFAAKPIRGLIEQEGKSWQPIQISFSGPVPAQAVVSIDGIEYAHQPLSAGEQTIEVLIPAVEAERHSTITVKSASATNSVTVSLKPVRKVVVYVLPHSHHDLGYTDLQANVEEKQIRNIDQGIDLARKTADYPERSRFVWNLEVLWGADLYLRRASAAKRAEFVQAVKNGWLALLNMPPKKLSTAQQRHLDAFLRFCPKAHELRRFILRFRAMLRWRGAKKLGDWIDSAAASPFRSVAQFASTLRRDLDAVKLSITTPWSNGPIEGHINRLKAIKRQMYGRAGFELLKARVLPWDVSSAA